MQLIIRDLIYRSPLIYMNYPCYWLIKELTYDNLHIQQSSIDPDRLTSGDYRVDKKFVAVIPE